MHVFTEQRNGWRDGSMHNGTDCSSQRFLWIPSMCDTQTYKQARYLYTQSNKVRI